MRTPDKLSPYMLIQEFLRSEPWKLLCACIMLNQTSAKQVHGIINDFFDKYPDEEAVLAADVDEMAALLKPMGFHNVKAKRIMQMTEVWVNGPWEKPEDISGVGKYASDSFKIFCGGYLITDVEDKELRNYVRWAQEESSRDVWTQGGYARSGGVQ